MLVAGGWTGSDYLSSTELLVGEASAWVLTGELPSPRSYLRGANIDNRVLMTGNCTDGSREITYVTLLHADQCLGGTDGTTFDDILEFCPVTKQWKLMDKMIQAKYAHGVSPIIYGDDVARICNKE